MHCTSSVRVRSMPHTRFLVLSCPFSRSDTRVDECARLRFVSLSSQLPTRTPGIVTREIPYIPFKRRITLVVLPRGIRFNLYVQGELERSEDERSRAPEMHNFTLESDRGKIRSFFFSF